MAIDLASARILVIGRGGQDAFATNIAVAAEAMTASVLHLDEDQLVPIPPRAVLLRKAGLRLSKWTAHLLHRKLVRRAIRYRPDLTIVGYDNLSPSTVQQIRSGTGSPIVLWFPDAISHFIRQNALLAPYDAIFFKDPAIVRRLSAVVGSRVQYLPEACPSLPVDDSRLRVGTTNRITVAGSAYPYRLKVLEQLPDDLRLRLDIYGTWSIGLEHPLHAQFRNEYLTGDRKLVVYRSSLLNINTVHPAEIEGANCRLFEIAGAGGCQVAEYRPVMGELFSIDSELFTYHQPNELERIIRRLDRLPQQSRQVGDAALRRAQRDHTYQVRLRQIAESLA